MLLLAAFIFLGTSVLVATSYRRASAPEIGAGVFALCAGIAVLVYAATPVSTEPAPLAATMPAAQAETAPTHSPQPKVVPAAFVARKAKAPAHHACDGLTGVESLQCLRCSDASGLGWLLCQERVRLAYCEHGEANEASCPSPIPASPPV